MNKFTQIILLSSAFTLVSCGGGSGSGSSSDSEASGQISSSTPTPTPTPTAQAMMASELNVDSDFDFVSTSAISISFEKINAEEQLERVSVCKMNELGEANLSECLYTGNVDQVDPINLTLANDITDLVAVLWFFEPELSQDLHYWSQGDSANWLVQY